MPKPVVHVYPLSRLVFAPATDWLKILRELESGRKQMYWSYKPVRRGAFALLGAGGKRRAQIYGEVEELAERAGGPRCARANLRALELFEKRFLPKIAAPLSNLMDEPGSRVDFAEVQLAGGPHFSIKDLSGRTRFLYLHPSEWSEGESEAFCELLTVVLEQRHHAPASALWFLDLRTGQRLRWPRSKARLRRRCEQAASLLAKLRSADLEKGGA